jgi:hypothetical protein
VEKIEDGNLLGGFAIGKALSVLPLYLVHAPTDARGRYRDLRECPGQPFNLASV